jgi:hypothetical protein
MSRRLVALPSALLVLLLPGMSAPPISARTAATLFQSLEPPELCLMPPEETGYQARAAAATADQKTMPADWPGKGVVGGDVPPARLVYDPHPTFNGMAVDPDNNIVVMSDENRSSLLTYDLKAGSKSSDTTPPRSQVIGSKVDLGFIAGVTLDPTRREMFTVNNDGGGVTVHAYDSHGDVSSVRTLTVPHQSWGLSLDVKADELAVTSQQYQGVSIYKRTATGTDRPVRTIRGENTQLADPHGVFMDSVTDELFTANHGNWTEMRSYAGDGPPLLVGEYVPGRFEKPSIRVYRASSDGNVRPIRSLQGPRTRLAWPMGLTVDAKSGELLVANYGTNEIVVYNKTADGDVAPARILGGNKTGIVGPIAVSIDHRNNELWVANYGDHTAVVFDRGASGNVEPKRIIRNAPAGTPTTGFTNASAAAYDPVRDQVLVPNCVSVPRISAFNRLANGNVAPNRIIEGQGTNLSRTMHGLAFDELHDEIIVPVALSGAVLVFKGGASGNEAPIRVIQGSKTGMIRPQTVEVDPINNEIVAADSSSRAILVYDRLANGDVEPKRKIGGSKTLFRDIIGIAVDAKRNVIVASTRSTDGFSGLLIFDRLADGDVAPLRKISGNMTGARGRFRQLKIDSERGLVYLAVQSTRPTGATPQKAADLYTNEASLKKLRERDPDRDDQRGVNRFNTAGFIGAWSLDDDGNVPPRYIIRGPSVGASGFAGVAFSTKHGEVYGVSGNLNGYVSWIVPEFFGRLADRTALKR